MVYAQVIRSRTADHERDEMHRMVSDEVIPALRELRGFVGALNLVDPPSGEAIMIVLWQSADPPRGMPLALGPGSIWEVTVRV
jgi:hypothetical protein